MTSARRLGALTEAVHAAVHLAPEPQDRYTALPPPDDPVRPVWQALLAPLAARAATALPFPNAMALRKPA